MPRQTRPHHQRQPRERNGRWREPHRSRTAAAGAVGIGALFLGVLAYGQHWLDFVPWAFLGLTSLEVTGLAAPHPAIMGLVGVLTLAALVVVAIGWAARRFGGNA